MLQFYTSSRVECEECHYPNLVFGPDLHKGKKTLLLGILRSSVSFMYQLSPKHVLEC